MWPFKEKQLPTFERKYSSVMVGMGNATWFKQDFRKFSLEGFQTNPIVYACVTKLAKAISSVDLHLYRNTVGELRRVDRHGLLDLINRPNSMWSGRQFLEKLATHYLIGGNAYLLGNLGADRAPSQLWLLPPEYMTVNVTQGDIMPRSYIYRPGQQEIVYPVDRLTGRSAICHLRTVNPLNEYYGLSPLAAAAHGVDIFNAGQTWNMSLLQNEGRPSGALQMRQLKDGSTQNLSDEQFARLKEEVAENYSGSQNAGRPLLLDSALEWVQMSLNAKDMDHRETMLTNARFIAACYGTPPQLVNIPGESTYSNYQQATMAYWGDTVLPLLGILLEDINRWLAPLFNDEKLFLWYDEEQIPALEPRRKEKSERINAALYMTYDEKREAMGQEAYEKPEEPGAGSLFVPANQIPIELAGTVDPNLHPALAVDEPATVDPAKPAVKPTEKPKE